MLFHSQFRGVCKYVCMYVCTLKRLEYTRADYCLVFPYKLLGKKLHTSLQVFTTTTGPIAQMGELLVLEYPTPTLLASILFATSL